MEQREHSWSSPLMSRRSNPIQDSFVAEGSPHSSSPTRQSSNRREGSGSPLGVSGRHPQTAFSPLSQSSSPRQTRRSSGRNLLNPLEEGHRPLSPTDIGKGPSYPSAMTRGALLNVGASATRENRSDPRGRGGTAGSGVMTPVLRFQGGRTSLHSPEEHQELQRMRSAERRSPLSNPIMRTVLGVSDVDLALAGGDDSEPIGSPHRMSRMLDLSDELSASYSPRGAVDVGVAPQNSKGTTGTDRAMEQEERLLSRGSTGSRGRKSRSNNAAELSNRGEDIALSHQVIERREVKSVAAVDLNALPVVEDQDQLQNIWASRAATLVSSYAIFSAVTTMMITAANVEMEVDQSTRDLIGNDAVKVLMNVLGIASAPYFLLLILRWNNYFAERMYYKLLKRSTIVDFPLTDYTTWLSRKEQVLFIVYSVLFALYAIAAFAVVKASFGNLLIFFNNFVSGVAIYWYYQQSIEPRFISLTTYIETFEDAEGKYHNIDATSLHRTARQLDTLTLAESEVPSYRSEMRRLFFRATGASETRQWVIVIAMYGTVLALVVLGSLYVVSTAEQNSQQRWEDKLNPCISACVQRKNLPGTVVDVDWTRCDFCVCKCLSLLKDMSALDNCASFLSVEGCTVARSCVSMTKCDAINALEVTTN